MGGPKVRAADRNGKEGGQGKLGHFTLGLNLLGAPGGGYTVKRDQNNRTVTLIQQSGRYSLDNFTRISC